MKKVYDFLARWTYELCIFFGTSSMMPIYLQRKYPEGDQDFIYCVVLFLTSAATFGLCFWYLKASWVLKEFLKMGMLTWFSILGLLISVSAGTGRIGLLPTDLYHIWRGVPADALICLGLFTWVLKMLQDAQEG